MKIVWKSTEERKGMKKGRILLVISFLLVLCLFTQKRDVILVLDTSLSMMGYGGSNIMDKVKTSVSGYIDKLEDGDRVTFVTFDTDIRVYPAVIVDDANDRDIIKKYISITPVTGKWTNTYSMMQAVFKQAEILEKNNDGRQIVIIVMTDGIDDPAPDNSGARLNIKEIATRYEGNDNWWIYLVNFSDIKAKDKAARDRDAALKKELQRVSDKSDIIQAGTDPNLGIKEVEKREIQNRSYAVLAVIGLVIAAIAIFLLLLLRRLRQLKVRGRLEYWNNELIKPTIETFSMTKFMRRDIFIGSIMGCQLRIREIEIRTPLRLSAVRVKGETKLALQWPSQEYSVEFRNRPAGDYIEDGDIFQVKNFTFKYFAE
jgi:hypothetical protein